MKPVIEVIYTKAIGVIYLPNGLSQSVFEQAVKFNDGTEGIIYTRNNYLASGYVQSEYGYTTERPKLDVTYSDLQAAIRDK